MIKRLSAGQRDWLLTGIVLLIGAGLSFLPPPPHTLKQSGKTAKAVVKQVDNSGLTAQGLLLYGSQKLIVSVNGNTFTANNELRGQMELDKVFKPGDTILVAIPENPLPQTVLAAQDHYRNFWSFTLFAVFCVLLCIFGSFTGVKALLSFLFSCLVIWKVVIPLVLHGYPASWIIFGAVVLLTAVITFLVAGPTKKGVAAFAGSISGILTGLLTAHLSGSLMHINGAGMPYVQTLFYSGYETLDILDIFTGSIILASSGAVMDLAMDIASGVEEVAYHNSDLPARELIRSGIRIGRSVVGTMTTTLLLAYSGGYLTLLMMFAVQGTPVTVFLNSTLVAPELLKTLIGSFALILTAPFTAVIAGWIFSRDRKDTIPAE